MNFQDITDRDLIITELVSELRTDAIREMIEWIAARRGFDRLRSESCLAEILRRHDRYPSGLGRGLAFPNARMAEIERPLLAIGLSRRGLNFEATDGKPAHVIFLYLGRALPPPEERHMLTRLSAALADPKVAARFMAASTAEEVWEIVTALDPQSPAIVH